MDDSHRFMTKSEEIRALRDRLAETGKMVRSLQAENATAQKYLDIVGVLIMVLDTSGCVRRINRMSYQILGYKDFEIIGRNFFECCIHRGRLEDIQLRYERFVGGKIQEFEGEWECDIVDEEGRERSVLWHGSPLFEDNGEIAGLLMSGEDITERKQAIRALEESELRFRACFEQNLDAMIITSMDGTVIEANLAAQELFGYSEDELLALRVFVLLDADSKLIHHAYSGSKKKTGMLRGDIIAYRKDGNMIDVEASSSRFFDANSNERCSIVLRDVSERKALEEPLQQVEKMESIGQLARGFSHHINNMLTGVIGNLELADLNHAEKKDNYLNKARNAADHASKMIDSLLEFSFKTTIKRTSVNLNELVRDAYEQYQSMLSPAIRFQIDLDETIPCIKLDRHMIQSAIIQMISNARDAIEEANKKASGETKGKTHSICLQTGWAKERAQELDLQDHFILIRVTDTGIGMDEKTRRKIFDPFFTTKSVAQGIGLGMAGVFGIVKQHGGWIDLKSRLKKGTEVTIFLPYEK